MGLNKVMSHGGKAIYYSTHRVERPLARDFASTFNLHDKLVRDDGSGRNALHVG